MNTHDVKTKPFTDIALQLILFGITVSLGVAMVKALSSTFEAAFGEDIEGIASAWLCFLCILKVSDQLNVPRPHQFNDMNFFLGDINDYMISHLPKGLCFSFHLVCLLSLFPFSFVLFSLVY